MRMPPQVSSGPRNVNTLIAAPKGVAPLACGDDCAGLSGMAYELCMQVCLQNS